MSYYNAKQRLFCRPITWWTSVIMAVVGYCTLKYLIPAFQPQNFILLKLSKAAPTLAPLVAIGFLLLAAKKLYDKNPADADHRKTDKDDMEDRKE